VTSARRVGSRILASSGLMSDCRSRSEGLHVVVAMTLSAGEGGAAATTGRAPAERRRARATALARATGRPELRVREPLGGGSGDGTSGRLDTAPTSRISAPATAAGAGVWDKGLHWGITFSRSVGADGESATPTKLAYRLTRRRTGHGALELPVVQARTTRAAGAK